MPIVASLSWWRPLAAGDAYAPPGRRTKSDIGRGICSTVPGQCTHTAPGTDGSSRTRTSRTRSRHLAPGETGSVLSPPCLRKLPLNDKSYSSPEPSPKA